MRYRITIKHELLKKSRTKLLGPTLWHFIVQVCSLCCRPFSLFAFTWFRFLYKSQHILGIIMEDKNALFEELSKKFPARKYTTFCSQMGVGYDEAKSILKTCKEDYNDALRDVLSQWDQRMKGVTRKQLEDALDGAEVGALCSIVRKH